MSAPFRLTRLWPGVYLPALVVEVGVGAMIPMVPVSATSLGADLATAGLLAAMLPIGQIAADVPAGAVAARIGDRRAMILACGIAAVAMAGAALATTVWVLGVCVFVVGVAGAVFGLARQSYLTEVTPALLRARALSTLGGVFRIGLFIGPFVGALVVHGGSPSNAYWLGAGTSVLAAIVVAVSREVPGADGVRSRDRGDGRSTSAVVREHLPLLVTLGVAIAAVGAVRGARQVVLPLWSEHLGFPPATTALVFGISGAVDMLLFYPAGKLMDARGRLWIAIPSMIVMGVSMLLLPLTHTVAAVGVVAILLGLGNGMGSGVVMTLGADVAPAQGRAQFLGAWRLLQDSGSALGPLLLAGGAAIGTLAGGVVATGMLGGLAAAALARFVPRWSVHANRTTRARAGL
ncbi:major facilitator superfamily MFS_1 [Beutenbergia cavernae DSM 12333]|uniref:Major facilitator superfamily MFS_1 n=1 Tax=Beutenbergia cavernae (strain ATCC BAA-8 / DSM 12333 / CCUG 43141 / JCM 11478 / NBRC 16432 / NCIMB 13614 / HKI 0122) TaxID=471853 RepID=C5BZF0_BEUC1|nr:MFS transporter [Beutenbergia cavernae]ACQ79122.1 major facilitator superfamily MFS_1 [Beutenbergia cavernae DSM 12333]